MPRREHRKSRNGCVQCKARRVKCAEDGPPCRNCTSRAISCNYAAQPRQTQFRADDQELATSTRQQPGWNHGQLTAQSCNAATARKHIFELELMHHYTSDTWQTLCHNHCQDAQRLTEEHTYLLKTIPQQALLHEFARHGLFALSALHLASLQQKSATGLEYVRAALQYQAWAQAGFAVAMNTIAETHAEVLISTSLAFSVLAVAVPRYLDSCLGPFHDDPLDNIIMAHRLFRGPYNILRGACATANLVPLALMLSPKDMSRFDDCEAETLNALNHLRSISTKRYRTASGTASDNYNPDLIDELEWAFRRYQAGNMTTALGWLISISEDFVTDLTEREAAASLLFLHWCVLLHRTSGLWWVPESGPVLISQLAVTLRDKFDWDDPSPEGRALTWCSQQVANG